MTKVQLAKRVAEVIVYGHSILFVFAIYVYFATPYDKTDVVQMVLMGSPTLAIVATSAFNYLSNQVADPGTKADASWARVALGGSIFFLLVLAVAYWLASVDHDLRIEDIKYAVGGAETVLGVYLGVIRDKLFPEVPKPAAVGGGDNPAPIGGDDDGDGVEAAEPPLAELPEAEELK